MHLSCTDTNTVSKRKEVRFHMTHVTYVFHRVHPKQLLSLWYVRRKPCSYLASRLALSPTGRNELPPEPRHLVVPLGVSKMICKPMVHLAQTMHLSCTDTNTMSKQKRSEIPHDPRHLGVPPGASKTISKLMVRLAQTVHLSCTDTNTVSVRKQVRFQMTHVT